MPFKAQKTHELVDGAKEWTSQKVRIVKAATKSKEAFQAAFNKERLQKSIAKMRGKRPVEKCFFWMLCCLYEISLLINALRF